VNELTVIFNNFSTLFAACKTPPRGYFIHPRTTRSWFIT